MRTTLNKAFTANNKEGQKSPSSVGTHPGKVEKMNDVLKKTAAAVAALEKENPETRAQYLKGIADAKAAQAEAAQAKEAATTEGDFDKACGDESRARDREQFYKRQLDRLDFSPRMKEADYYDYVDKVSRAVEEAADDFQKAAKKAIAEIAAAKAAYLATAIEADNILRALDRSANVLQVKYRYKETHYTGGAVTLAEDHDEWKKHALRYIGTGLAYSLATMGDDGEIDEKVVEAWHAVPDINE